MFPSKETRHHLLPPQIMPQHTHLDYNRKERNGTKTSWFEKECNNTWWARHIRCTTLQRGRHVAVQYDVMQHEEMEKCGQLRDPFPNHSKRKKENLFKGSKGRTVGMERIHRINQGFAHQTKNPLDLSSDSLVGSTRVVQESVPEILYPRSKNTILQILRKSGP